jgi:TfoX/Sxy family transcriptional regulator of competence genes
VIDDVTLARYEALVAAHPGLERKRAKIPYTSVNGHMFSFLTSDGTLALRLSPEDREAFVDRYASEPVIQHDTVMKEYVRIPQGLLDRLDELEPWFDRSVTHARSLKPKKTSRSRSQR